MAKQEAMIELAHAIAARCGERELRDPERFPRESFDEVRASGLLLAPLSPELGGSGSSLAHAVAIIETMASGSPSMALLAAMPLGLAGIYALGREVAPPADREAWASQIEAVAADYRAGAWYAAANSERGAAGSLDATKTMVARGADGGFRITGEKILASSGSYASRFFSTAKVSAEDVPGAGVVEFFFVRPDCEGVTVLSDWDGFGMRPTESQTVRYDGAPVESMMGFPDFLKTVQPLEYWFCLFAAIPLGCAASMLRQLGVPAPSSPALRLRFAEALMRIEALRAYLRETASMWRAGAGTAFAARVLRTKTYVSQESTKICAELFALAGGRHYTRKSAVARLLCDSFAGTALRPPLPLALDALIEQFTLEPDGSEAVGP